MIGALYGETLAGRTGGRPQTEIEHADGSITPLWADDWRRLRPGDASLIERCSGPTLDVGSGPGRLAVALAERGVPTLGIDVAPHAVRIARSAGSLTLLRDVFGRVPGTGRWTVVLLADGTIGIGGDPSALLRPGGRAARAVRPGAGRGAAAGPGAATRTGQAAALPRRAGQQAGDWFPWAQVGADQLSGIAAEAGLPVAETWSCGGRWFATLARAVES